MKQKETVVYGYLVFKIAEAIKCFCPFVLFALKLYEQQEIYLIHSDLLLNRIDR